MKMRFELNIINNPARCILHFSTAFAALSYFCRIFPALDISLNKFISDTGYCSRREADKLIEAGRVLLNNRVATLGSRVRKDDEVVVDGSIMSAPRQEKKVYLALNKPTGITTTSESHVPGNIIDFVKYPKRIFPIGRLDKDSEGLIFLTNDGDIVNKILRAGNRHEKEYIVRVNKPIDGSFLQKMSSGVQILGERTLPCKVVPAGRQTFRIVLTQGLNRQIRRMCEELDYHVVSLQRIRIMNIRLDKLPLGKWRYLSEPEIQQLLDSVKDSAATATIPEKKRNKPLKNEKPSGAKNSNAAPVGNQPKGKPAPSTGLKPEKGSSQRHQSPVSKPKSSSYKEFRKRGRSGKK